MVPLGNKLKYMMALKKNEEIARFQVKLHGTEGRIKHLEFVLKAQRSIIASQSVIIQSVPLPAGG